MYFKAANEYFMVRVKEISGQGNKSNKYPVTVCLTLPANFDLKLCKSLFESEAFDHDHFISVNRRCHAVRASRPCSNLALAMLIFL